MNKRLCVFLGIWICNLTVVGILRSEAEEAARRSPLIATFFMPAHQPEDRFMPVEIKQLGWKGWIENHCEPLAELGYRRFIIHTPFGRSEEKGFRFDQAVEAREQGATWLTNSFTRDWRPFVRRRDVEEVIAYMGYLAGDSDLDSRVRNSRLGSLNQRLGASLAPVQDAGMSVAFDAVSSKVKVDGWISHYIQMVDAQQRAVGLRSYIEPRPQAWFLPGKRMNVICEEPFWHRSNPEKYPQDSGKWAMPTREMSGEIVRLSKFTHHGSEGYLTRFDWEPEVIRGIVADGHTAAISAEPYGRYGWKPNDILTAPKEHPDGLVALWKMAGGGGSYLRDASGRSNHGRLLGGVRWNSTGLRFVGEGAAVEMGRKKDLEIGSGDFTVVLRVQSKGPTSGVATLLKKGSSVPAHKGYWIRVGKTGRLQTLVADGKENWLVSKSGGPSLHDGKWHTIRWVFDRRGESRVDIDGKFAFSQKFGDSEDITRLIDQLYLGASNSEGRDSWNGEISAVAIYKKVARRQ